MELRLPGRLIYVNDVNGTAVAWPGDAARIAQSPLMLRGLNMTGYLMDIGDPSPDRRRRTGGGRDGGPR